MEGQPQPSGGASITIPGTKTKVPKRAALLIVAGVAGLILFLLTRRSSSSSSSGEIVPYDGSSSSPDDLRQQLEDEAAGLTGDLGELEEMLPALPTESSAYYDPGFIADPGGAMPLDPYADVGLPSYDPYAGAAVAVTPTQSAARTQNFSSGFAQPRQVSPRTGQPKPAGPNTRPRSAGATITPRSAPTLPPRTFTNVGQPPSAGTFTTPKAGQQPSSAPRTPTSAGSTLSRTTAPAPTPQRATVIRPRAT